MILKELFAKIGFDVDEKKLDGVEKRLEGIKQLLEAFAAAEVVRGIAEMTEKFGEMAEQIHISSSAAGVTVEAFQQMAFSAKQAGVSQDELGAAMGRLARSIYMARTGSREAQLAFQRFGITPQQVMNFRNADEAMKAVADGVKRMGGGFQALGPLMELTGRNSRNMVEWLSKGSGAMTEAEKRAKELGAVLTEEQVMALTKATHAAQAFGSVLKVLGATIAANFAPSVETAIDEFLKFYQVNKDIIQLEIKKWVWDITFALGFVWGAVKFVVQGFLDFAKAHELLVRRAGELLFLFGALVSTLFVFGKAIQIAGIIMGPFLAILRGIGAVFALMESPILLIVAGIGALVLGVQALWKVLTGGSFKDTWLGQIAGSVGSVLPGLWSGIKGFASTATNLATGGVASSIASAVGLTSPSPANIPKSGGAPSSVTTSVHAPVTVNIPHGADPKMVGDKVKEGVQAHLDRVHREASRSLRPSLAY